MSYKHELKILPEYLDAVINGSKTFEIRKNDRDFKEGDVVILKEWNVLEQRFEKRTAVRTIGFVTNYEQKEGYVVFSLLNLYKIL